MALTEEEKKQIELEERAKTQSNPAVINPHQKHLGAATLSFFIAGLGQTIKGQISRGIIIFLAVGFLLGMSFSLPIMVVPGIIVWIWQISDAYNK
jgi:TM2 domain-containing membrane protein YozV